MTLKTSPLAHSESELPPEFGVVVDLSSYKDGVFDPISMSDEDFKEKTCFIHILSFFGEV